MVIITFSFAYIGWCFTKIQFIKYGEKIVFTLLHYIIFFVYGLGSTHIEVKIVIHTIRIRYKCNITSKCIILDVVIKWNKNK